MLQDYLDSRCKVAQLEKGKGVVVDVTPPPLENLPSTSNWGGENQLVHGVVVDDFQSVNPSIPLGFGPTCGEDLVDISKRDGANKRSGCAEHITSLSETEEGEVSATEEESSWWICFRFFGYFGRAEKA
ncbi:hypothetical protein BVC80_1241g13 [Macleaya cordata]|uniref:Uncharacterized protein n=1 Tax=Macleaya cordata TaxID=56857 RepID=A0A200QHD5_MACCD|nr:hypothetical protein BVC80_1241g13 [Macleaya cordata]